jgi:hypothetical protein
VPVPVGFAEVAIPGRLGGSAPYGYVVFGVDNTIFPDPSLLADTVWTSAFEPNVLPLLDSSVTWGPIEVSLGTTAGDLSGVGTESGPGGSVITSLPPSVAVLVNKITALGGRQNRGRMYWPWAAAETSVDEAGVWDPAAVANFQSALFTFLAALDTASCPMVILHADGSTPTPVTQLNVQGLLATQRRRLRR